MRFLILFTLGTLTTTFSSGCVHPQIGYKKAYLLDPMMDPAKTSPMMQSMSQMPPGFFENGQDAPSSGNSGSCPTCGG